MRLLFTELARLDLDRLREFLGEKSPSAARRAADRIKYACTLIAQRPLIGRLAEGPSGPRSDVRELPVAFGARGYLVRYQVLATEIRILRIWHGREDWQREAWGDD